ncbi:MAG: DNA-3-methyladenine glycosylase I [Bifidobacteriaceae bacterium]|jgi:DNA-3-methyladenine glycosylase I|nr:DNA-3-methyladenine glycosylase I [Bifidobacteriaceae bacterium]MCI1978417.1 DNA-3-methyladenine glycosylase I [Bifidobacteriaceae bacterium]
MTKKMMWFPDDQFHQKHYPDNPLYLHYDRDVWNIPSHNDKNIFEQLTLGVFAAGLNWHNSFIKYPAMTKVFHDWEIRDIAEMTEQEVIAALNNSQIIRSKRKIIATINNAKVAIEIQKRFGSLDNYFWSMVRYRQERLEPKTVAEIPVRLKITDRIAEQMKKDGFRFIGPVSACAFLISIGIISVRLDEKGIEEFPVRYIKTSDKQGKNSFNYA